MKHPVHKMSKRVRNVGSRQEMQLNIKENKVKRKRKIHCKYNQSPENHKIKQKTDFTVEDIQKISNCSFKPFLHSQYNKKNTSVCKSQNYI